MLKYAALILWRKKGVPANFYAFASLICIYPIVYKILVGLNMGQ